VVEQTDAGAHPGAVMVHAHHALAADLAVVCPRGFDLSTLNTESEPISCLDAVRVNATGLFVFVDFDDHDGLSVDEDFFVLAHTLIDFETLCPHL